jgi:nitrite reductase (NADH) small subunit
VTAIDTGTGTWVRVCRLDQLTPFRGSAAKVGDHQIALFRWPGGDYPVVNDRNGRPTPGNGDTVYAIGNKDPFSGAYVMSRGVVGDRAGVHKVAGPVYKQSFDLSTGRCLDDETVQLTTFPVRLAPDGWIEVETPE